MTAVGESAGTPLRHTAGTDGTIPKHNALARRKYSLLAPTGPEFDPAAVGDQVSRDGHEATRGTAERSQKETEAGDRNRQRAFSARGMQGDNVKERIPPKRLLTLNA